MHSTSTHFALPLLRIVLLHILSPPCPPPPVRIKTKLHFGIHILDTGTQILDTGTNKAKNHFGIHLLATGTQILDTGYEKFTRVAVRRTYVFTLQEVEKICRTLQVT